MTTQKENNGFLNAFKNYHDERYRLFLAKHALESEKIKVVEDFLAELVKKSDFAICVRIEALRQIIEDDRFKTQIETKKGSTVGGSEARREATSCLFGINADDLAVDEFPKYGFLSSKNKMRDLASNPDVFYHYGSVIITLKRENLFNRTTMSVGTTLDFGEFLRKTPTFVSDPKALATNNLSAFYQKIAEGKLSADFPNQLSDVFNGALGFDCYELQFHGEINFSNDVAKVEYYPLYGYEEVEFEKLAPLLSAKGIRCGSIVNFDL